MTFLRRFSQTASGFRFLDLAIIMFLLSKVVSLASNLQPGGPGLCIYVPLYSQASGSLFVTYDSQGCGGAILIRFHAEHELRTERTQFFFSIKGNFYLRAKGMLHQSVMSLNGRMAVKSMDRSRYKI
jgi:hypothetical protein